MNILLNTLKWSTAIGAAAFVLTLLKPLLDKRYSARWRYGVWLAMAILLLLAPVPWDAFLPQTPVEPPLVIEVPMVSVSRQEGPALPPSNAVPQPNAPARFPLEQTLAGLWLSGAALVLLYHLAGTWWFTRRARRWSRPAGADTLQIYKEICREMGLKKTPPLCRSATVDSPMAAGLFRPRLLLPEEEIGPREMGFILRHELTHYRRHDLWYKLVLLLANALHWFNPLIWLLRRESEKDLELTCDDAVVAGADAETRRAYSETLLSSIRRQRQRAVLSTHFYGGNSVMKERFRNILGKRGRKRGIAVLAAALAVTIAAACSIGVRASVPENSPAVSTPPAPETDLRPLIQAVPEGEEDAEVPPSESDALNSPVSPAPEPEPIQTQEPAFSAAAPEENSGPTTPELAFDPYTITSTRITGDFDGDGEPDPVFLEQYEIIDDPVTNVRFYVPRHPELGYPSLVSELDEESGLPVSIYNNDLLGIPVAEGAGLSEPHTPTPAVMGDYNGDGVRDTEIEINGRIYPLVWNPDEGWFDPLPGGIDGVFSSSGDYDGDGKPDSEVLINGQRYQITPNPEGGVTYTEIGPGGSTEP